MLKLFKSFTTLTENVLSLRQSVSTQQKEQDDINETIFEKIESLNTQLLKQQESIDILMEVRKKKESDEPWMEVLGGEITKDGQMELKLDWNDAFIAQLQQNGYRGNSEQQLVSNWLGKVYGILKEEANENTSNN